MYPTVVVFTSESYVYSFELSIWKKQWIQYWHYSIGIMVKLFMFLSWLTENLLLHSNKTIGHKLANLLNLSLYLTRINLLKLICLVLLLCLLLFNYYILYTMFLNNKEKNPHTNSTLNICPKAFNIILSSLFCLS